jgi:hypothetical protein
LLIGFGKRQFEPRADIILAFTDRLKKSLILRHNSNMFTINRTQFQFLEYLPKYNVQMTSLGEF